MQTQAMARGELAHIARQIADRENVPIDQALKRAGERHPELKARAFTVGAATHTAADDGAHIVRTLVKQGRTREQAEATLAKTHPNTWKAYEMAFAPPAPDPRAELARHIRTYSEQHKVSRSVAARAVVQAHPDLARQLTPDGGASSKRERSKFLAAIGAPASDAKRVTRHAWEVETKDKLGQPTDPRDPLTFDQRSLLETPEATVIETLMAAPKGELYMRSRWVEWLRTWCVLNFPPPAIGTAPDSIEVFDRANAEQERIWRLVRAKRIGLGYPGGY